MNYEKNHKEGKQAASGHIGATRIEEGGIQRKEKGLPVLKKA